MSDSADTPMDVEALHLFDTQVQACPYPAYKRLRDESPVHKCPASGMYLVTRYDDVRRVLTDPETFSSRTQGLRGGPESEARANAVTELFKSEGWVPAATLAGRDDPEHKQMRSIFNQAFRPRVVQELDPEVRDLAYQLIDDFLPDGHCDFVRQFAIPLPLQIIGTQMGANPADIWKIKSWTDAFFHRISVMLPKEQELDTVRKEIEAQHYFQPIFEKLRKNPNGTLLSELVNTVIEEWGRPLTDNELHAEMMADTFVGGSETTTNALSAGVKLLIENPDVWGRLKDEPDKVKVFIEEVLRLESPVQSLMRITTRDVELSGGVIPKGSLVNVRYAAANRDDRKFDNPDAIDLDRKSPGAHMAFGSGVHHCLGAPLARRELIWSFTALLEKIDEMWFSPEKNDFSYHPHYLLRSLKRLEIEFRPA
ncbi:MAG: cytochrome P450 [Pseudomonadota bacterium]